MENNALALQLKENNIEQETAISLKNSFMPYFEQAEMLGKKAKEIVIKSADQIEEIKIAREARLQLKNIRVNVERTRKELKEESLRKGKAIDGLANVIKYLIVPIEEHLQKQEDFVKIQEQLKKDQLRDERKAELVKYDVVETDFYNLGGMAENSYNQLLKNSKLSYQAKIDLANKMEDERIAHEKAELEERERIKKENKRLQEEAEKREKEMEVERKKQQNILAKQKAKADAERKERERLENEIREKKEAEEKAQMELIEKERKLAEEKAEAEREEKIAPDKIKLEKLALNITRIEMPELKDEKAKDIILNVVDLLNDASNFIKRECINL